MDPLYHYWGYYDDKNYSDEDKEYNKGPHVDTPMKDVYMLYDVANLLLLLFITCVVLFGVTVWTGDYIKYNIFLQTGIWDLLSDFGMPWVNEVNKK